MESDLFFFFFFGYCCYITSSNYFFPSNFLKDTYGLLIQTWKHQKP